MLKGLIQIIIGLLFFVGVAYLLTFTSWAAATLSVLQGGLVFFIFFIGVGLLLLGLSELKG